MQRRNGGKGSRFAVGDNGFKQTAHRLLRQQFFRQFITRYRNVVRFSHASHQLLWRGNFITAEYEGHFGRQAPQQVARLAVGGNIILPDCPHAIVFGIDNLNSCIFWQACIICCQIGFHIFFRQMFFQSKFLHLDNLGKLLRRVHIITAVYSCSPDFRCLRHPIVDAQGVQLGQAHGASGQSQHHQQSHPFLWPEHPGGPFQEHLPGKPANRQTHEGKSHLLRQPIAAIVSEQFQNCQRRRCAHNSQTAANQRAQFRYRQEIPGGFQIPSAVEQISQGQKYQAQPSQKKQGRPSLTQCKGAANPSGAICQNLRPIINHNQVA